MAGVMGSVSTSHDLGNALVRALESLEVVGGSFALVGGLAVGARGRPRFTSDIDLVALAETDAEAEHLVRAMVSRGYGLNATVENQRTGRLGTVRLIAPGSRELLVDLLFAACGIENEVVAGASQVTLAGASVPVASRAHLVAMKVLAMSERRPDDRGDVLALLKLADDAEIDIARAAVTLILKRGYGQDLDLTSRLEELVVLARSPLAEL